MKDDFTTGSIYRKLYVFSLPILLTNLLQISMQLINSLWVGNLLGSSALAAVTNGATVMTVVLAFIIGINNATLTVFGQLKGKNDVNEIKSYLSTYVILLAVLSFVVSGFGYIFVESLLTLLNTPLSLMEPAKEYLRISFVGTIFLVFYNFIGSVLRAFGDSKTPLYFVLMATILNAVLDPLFIAGFGFGVAGAAYATIVAQALTFLYSLDYIARRFKQHTFKLQVPKFIEIKTIFRLGIPSGVQMVVIHAGMTVILSVVNTFGEGVVAGFGAAQRLDSIILLPAMALGTAVNAMTAQNIGANRWDRVGETSKAGMVYNLSIMFVIALALFVFAEPLVKLFIRDSDSVAFGSMYLKVIAFFYPFLGINFILNGAVRGSGAMFHVLILNIISLWLLRVPITAFAANQWGEIGIPLGIGTSFFISSFFAMAYYRWGSWRRLKLFTD